eukprot:1151876-Pelagomonas_calceolata.AAC.5
MNCNRQDDLKHHSSVTAAGRTHWKLRWLAGNVCSHGVKLWRGQVPDSAHACPLTKRFDLSFRELRSAQIPGSPCGLLKAGK